METDKVAVDPVVLFRAMLIADGHPDPKTGAKGMMQNLPAIEQEYIVKTAKEFDRLSAEARSAGRGGVGEDALREALARLRDLPIDENDGPNTLHLDGSSYTGPAVDWTFKIIRMVKEIARAALSPQPTATEARETLFPPIDFSGPSSLPERLADTPTATEETAP